MKLFVTSVHFLQTEGHIDSSVYLSLINVAWHMILRTDTTNNDKDNLILKEW